jgi:hypothetical protein
MYENGRDGGMAERMKTDFDGLVSDLMRRSDVIEYIRNVPGFMEAKDRGDLPGMLAAVERWVTALRRVQPELAEAFGRRLAALQERFGALTEGTIPPAAHVSSEALPGPVTGV